MNRNLTKTGIDVSIIIISWNTRDLLAQCLQSLLQVIQDIQAEIVVVDDGSAQYVAKHFPNACLIRNDCGRCFAAVDLPQKA
jgi:glycosyltransferase involved in cell wall biosynthesis